jgi:hypothetical protein
MFVCLKVVFVRYVTTVFVRLAVSIQPIQVSPQNLSLGQRFPQMARWTQMSAMKFLNYEYQLLMRILLDSVYPKTWSICSEKLLVYADC